MIESVSLKDFRIARTFLQTFIDLQAKLEYLKNVHPEQFSKIHFVIYFHPSHHLSHPHFLVVSYHLSSDVSKIKPRIIFRLSKI